MPSTTERGASRGPSVRRATPRVARADVCITRHRRDHRLVVGRCGHVDLLEVRWRVGSVPGVTWPTRPWNGPNPASARGGPGSPIGGGRGGRGHAARCRSTRRHRPDGSATLCTRDTTHGVRTAVGPGTPDDAAATRDDSAGIEWIRRPARPGTPGENGFERTPPGSVGCAPMAGRTSGSTDSVARARPGRRILDTVKKLCRLCVAWTNGWPRGVRFLD